MKMGKLAGALVTMVALVLCLAACGGSGSSAGKYQGHEARDAAELREVATKAIAAGKAVQENEESASSDADGDGDVTKQEKDAEVATAFGLANDDYRKGNYDAAVTGYEDVLKAHPLHGGANTNIVLAKLQDNKPEEALAAALQCVYLFPEEQGCLLNAQVAATACGYGASDIEEVLDYVLGEADGTEVYLSLTSGGDASLRGGYDYNKIWNRVETELYEELHPAKGEASDADVQETYALILANLKSISVENPDDKDIGYLQAYVEAVGKQLGLE